MWTAVTHLDIQVTGDDTQHIGKTGETCVVRPHNREGRGFNFSPAIKARGSLPNRERAFCMWFVELICARRGQLSLSARVNPAACLVLHGGRLAV